MSIVVHNVTATSATVTWPSSPGCPGSFYSIVYHPEVDSMLTGQAHKSFLKEDRVPTSQTSASLTHLSPLTPYVLCVTCQAAGPSGEQCQVFYTLEEVGESHGGLVMGAWLASSLLLLVIAAVLLYGCFHSWCQHGGTAVGTAMGSDPTPHNLAPHGSQECRPQGVGPASSPSCSEGDSQMATIIENPFSSPDSTSHCEPPQEMVAICENIQLEEQASSP